MHIPGTAQSTTLVILIRQGGKAHVCCQNHQAQPDSYHRFSVDTSLLKGSSTGVVWLHMQRRWLWAGGLVLGGYQPPAAATLRLGPSFGIGRRELLMCWGAAYAAAATGLALQLVQLVPAMNQVMLKT